jgi:hypothetical protein
VNEHFRLLAAARGQTYIRLVGAAVDPPPPRDDRDQRLILLHPQGYPFRVDPDRFRALLAAIG